MRSTSRITAVPAPPEHERSSSFIANVLKVMAGTASAQVILYVASPLLARIFAPQHFGTAFLITVSASLVNIVSSLRYEVAIVLPKDDRDARVLASLCLFLNGIAGGVIALAIWLGGDWLATLFELGEAAGCLWYLPVVAFVGGITQVVDATLTRSRQFGILARYRARSAGMGVAAQLTAALCGWTTAGGLLIGKVMGPALASACFWLQRSRPVAGGESRAPTESWRGATARLARQYRDFPLFNTWGTVANYVAVEMLTWVLGAFHGAAAVGFLGLGSRLIRIPMQLIGRSVGDVFLQEGARAHESGRLGEVTQSVFRAAVCLGCVPSLLVLAAGEELVVVVFGEPWREAGVYVQILAPVVFFRFLSSPISQVFSITGKQRTHMRMNFVHLVITAGLVGGACLSANARTVVASYAVASTLKYCWFSWVLLGAAGASRKQALVDLGAAAGMGLPGLVLVLGLKLAADLPAAAIAGAALAAGALTAPVVLAAARGSRLRAGGADTAA